MFVTGVKPDPLLLGGQNYKDLKIAQKCLSLIGMSELVIRRYCVAIISCFI